MNSGLKDDIDKAMKEIAERRPGKSRLVYSKQHKQIVIQRGTPPNKQNLFPTGLTIHDW